jgi:DNA-binding MarR family transcriptional regulator
MYICTVKLEEAIKTKKFRNGCQKAALNILYTAWWYRSHINNVLKPYGMTPEQYNVLRILKGSYPGMMCVKDISSRMIEKSSNVPRIIDRLEIKKLIRRNRGEDDGRQTMIELTKAGMAVLVEASKEMNQCDDQLIGLTETEAEQLNVILEKLRNS